MRRTTMFSRSLAMPSLSSSWTVLLGSRMYGWSSSGDVAVLRRLGLLRADASRIGRCDLHRDLTSERLEVVRPRHEVCLAVELDHRADTAGVDVAVDDALAGLAARPSFRR